MSSPSNSFECRWHASRQLLAAYVFSQLFALGSLLLLELPLWASLSGALCCLLHGIRVLPRQILLTHPQAFLGLRRDADGWQLWNRAAGWQSVQLRPDSLALPWVVVLRFRLQGERRIRAICVPRDSQAADIHRRLRVRLKFSRRRWAAPE
ncbi:protein YgfX [Pseudomonas sp. Sample_24]|uniref:protein YgfX n=1 Tax=Pseudomonas sp. Sample_24 TaxID=2448268 RepID=UPI001032C7C0|nr:protein YgfX [Pseudomonas sp. Sample_24]